MLLSMSSNRLGEKATFGMAVLSQTTAPAADSSSPPSGITAPPAVMFPELQVLRLHDNSIRSILNLQLFGYTGAGPVTALHAGAHLALLDQCWFH